MQIPPSGAANAAAGIVSQATSKDRAAGTTADAAHIMAATQIERVARSEAASADRDAQGGGAGLDARGQPGSHSDTDARAADADLPVLPPEPPSQLDIVG